MSVSVPSKSQLRGPMFCMAAVITLSMLGSSGSEARFFDGHQFIGFTEGYPAHDLLTLSEFCRHVFFPSFSQSLLTTTTSNYNFLFGRSLWL